MVLHPELFSKSFFRRGVILCVIGVMLLLFSGLSRVSASTVPIEFNVNMTAMIEEGKFDPSTEFVDVAGTFNNWGSDLIKLSDPDQDSVYSVTVDGFTPGTTIEYKFRLNGQWDGREEFPGSGNNRVYTVKKDSNVIRVWYNNELPETGPPTARFDLSAAKIATGDLVQVSNRSYGNITHWDWSFEGGTPAVSNRKNPSIQYTGSGTFDVTLIARDSTDGEADTLTKSDVITVTTPSAGDRQTYWWNERIFYEVFVRSFYDSDGDGIGDFDGLRQKLDYLNDGNPETDSDLGVTALWLMPIHPSPTYHGYDVTDYRAINPDYGTMEDFKAFLEAAHSRGIKVIIDFVMNHSSSRHPWFEKSAIGHGAYRDFYRWKETKPGYSGPWGQQVWHERNGWYYYGLFWEGMPDLNYDTRAVKDSMFAHAEYWLKDIGIDGFRLDAVLYIHEEGDTLENTQSTYEFWGDFNTKVEQADSMAMTVGEAWQPTDIAVNYFKEGRIDYGFEFDLSQAIRDAVSEGDVTPLIARMQKVTSSYRYQQYGTFLTNHDQTRAFNEFDKNVSRNKAAASIYLTLPGVPYIYYGEEIGMMGAKPDPNIRRPMQWLPHSYAGFSTSEPWQELNHNYPTYNVKSERADSSSLWHHYNRLIDLRNDHPALQTGTYTGVPASSDSVFAFIRQNDSEHLMVVTNLGRKPSGKLDLYISGNLLTAGNPMFNNLMRKGDSVRVQVQSAPNSSTISGVDLEAYETAILELDDPAYTAIEGKNSAGVREFRLHQNYPNPFNPSTTISFQIPYARDVFLAVYNVLGRRVATLVDGRLRSGKHSVRFNGEQLSSGVYIYRIEAGGFSDSGKMLLLR